MKYKITLITPPFPTKRIPKQTVKDFEDIIIFSGCRLKVWSDDGPNPFVCPLKGYSKGHKFTLVCDHISEVQLEKIMKKLNSRYLIASAIKIPER